MKVKCIKLYNNRNEKITESPSLTIGREYVVLEVICDPNSGISYRLVSDAENKSPAVFKAKQFEVVNSDQPLNWVVNVEKDGFIKLAPSDWNKTSFWEDCYDGDPKALEIYKREARIIYKESGIK